MNEKDLRKLSRRQLLELLLAQSQRIDELEQNLMKAKELLKKRQLVMRQAGSIAEAALQLSGIFEAAQKAADVYLESVQEIAKRENTDIEL